MNRERTLARGHLASEGGMSPGVLGQVLGQVFGGGGGAIAWRVPRRESLPRAVARRVVCVFLLFFIHEFYFCWFTCA